MNKILICPDHHCRDFYKPLLQVKDIPIIFLGDYMDPYYWEGFTNEEGIVKLEEIFDFARNNKNVKLLVGNHDLSMLFSYMGFERTSYLFYGELHRLYRDNIDLLHPILKIGDTIFTHAGICNGWINTMNHIFEEKENPFRLTEETTIPYIENEFALELKNDVAPNQHAWHASLNSPIFCIGRSRGGDAPYGGPFWADFEYDHWNRPDDWKCYQICGHTQCENTGSIRIKDGIACLDSRAIFEYDLDTHFVKPSEINDEKTKAEISKKAWEGGTIRFRENYEKSE